MASYPIWNDVTACVYKSNRSWGARKNASVDVLVGTSASNSHKFVSHSTTHRLLDDGTREYRFYVDGECVKRAVLRKGESDLEYIEPGDA